MQTSRFWKGEIGLKGLVKDQGRVYAADLYIKGGRVRDYSCSCGEGNSYKGMCAHGEALFAYYQEYEKSLEEPPVHTSQEASAVIREYTNRQVAAIMETEEEGQARLEPLLDLSGRQVRVEWRAGKERLYPIKDLEAFSRAVRQGSFLEYGRSGGFYHSRRAFSEDSRGLLDFLMETVELSGGGPALELKELARDRFFRLVQNRTIAARFPGGTLEELEVKEGEPRLKAAVSRQGRDGLKVSFEGLLEPAGTNGGAKQPENGEAGEGSAPLGRCLPALAVIGGERGIYLLRDKTLYCCGPACSRAVRPFLEAVRRERGGALTVGERDIPLFYSRVLKSLGPWAVIREERISLKDYEPEPLRAQFRFDSPDGAQVRMEPCLSYGEYRFHPVEDEELPHSLCRDVPGEFEISRLINRYFKYKSSDGVWLVIRDDDEAVYRLLTEGIREFKERGEVLVSKGMERLRLIAPPRASVSLSLAEGWLELKVDTGGIPAGELSKILSAYSRKKKYYRLKTGEFLSLGEGGLYTVAKVAGELGIPKKELESGRVRLPAYRAMYLDSVLKDGDGVVCLRDQVFKRLVRAVKTVEDEDAPLPPGFEGELREYQKAGYRWLRTLDEAGFGGILADDMGLGKTVQVIALLAAVHAAEEAVSLIVCPASLVYNWEHELKRFAPGLSCAVAGGPGSQRRELLEKIRSGRERVRVLITSYDLLKRDGAFYQEMSFRFQIIDEAQYIKNAATQSARAVKSVRAKSRFALTGTPIENRLGELWSIFDYLMPGFLFSAQRFKREYEIPIVRDQDGEVLARLRRMTAPFILRRVKSEVLKELPEKLEQVVYCGMEEEQGRLYAANALRLKELLERTGEEGLGEERFRILADLLRLRQICCDPRLCYEGYRGGSAKLEALAGLVKRSAEGGHKMLLFSQFTSMLELIRERLQKEGISCWELTGSTPKAERLEMARAFSKDQTPVFLISLKAGGTGLNLTAADMVIHYDPWWNAAAQEQATDRSHRMGQEKQVTVYRLIAKNTVEENILRLQAAKSRLSDQVVSGEGGALKSFDRETLLRLLEEA